MKLPHVNVQRALAHATLLASDIKDDATLFAQQVKLEETKLRKERDAKIKHVATA